ncbi:hypothetical protein KIH31_09250 [Paenarthrobacter sp. DKR-5]|uniref:hypothetical protein n=1 Tax=Paenarthrobacter sp. DKR-5 TaxID=2835535 RepID=UPI001BDC4734|nr:hypothetical protein [Paenarthrobacter sp. DKR-5]MBT1002791.1 hypothetical protein [Paenarthrobacter sp. DKR-5]
MYAWLFGLLPGPLWVRILLAVLIVAVVLVLLAEFVFPWFAHVINLEDSTVGG